jgi:hypothetical protein
MVEVAIELGDSFPPTHHDHHQTVYKVSCNGLHLSAIIIHFLTYKKSVLPPSSLLKLVHKVPPKPQVLQFPDLSND